MRQFFNNLTMQEVFDFYFKYLSFILDTTWVWMPFVLAVVFFKSWMYYIQRYYWRTLDWIMLEVKPPREVERTPKTMEQVFAGLWGSFGTVGNKYEKYIKGKIQDYFSFEIAGRDGEMHFYIRTLRKFRDLVEAQIYSQYPQAEIKEVEDYTKSVPYDTPNKNWDLWGARLKLDKDEVYPIRTYPHLIDVTQTKQPNFLDPLAGLLENLGKLKPGEQIWIQMLFRPVLDDWCKKSYKTINKLIGKKEEKKIGLWEKELSTWQAAIGGVAQELVSGTPAEFAKKDEKKDELTSLMLHLSPRERDIATEIGEKAGKRGYEVKLQFAYIGRREVFSMANVSAIMGFFTQFANLNMNSLKPEARSMTKAHYAFAKVRKAYKQRKLMRLLRQRSFWEKGNVFNIEEMATVYHFPTMAVQAPVTPYIEVKKGGPPIGLPME